MPGLSDYAASAGLAWAAGVTPVPSIAARYLALFTAMPNDSGSGGTEASGGSYARVQIAGTVTVSGSSGAPSTSAATITLSANVPAWVAALGTNGSGCNVYDVTGSKQLGTISAAPSSGATITLTGNASNNGSLSDTLLISAFPAATIAAGSEPATAPAYTQNGAQITFAQASATWGTIIGIGVYDALTTGNLLQFDYLGNYKWLPFSCTSASPGVLTAPAHSFSNSDPVVVSAKFGGTLPTTGGSWSGVLTVANSTTDTFTAGVNTTGTGDGMVRKIVQQATVTNGTLYFAAASLVLSSA